MKQTNRYMHIWYPRRIFLDQTKYVDTDFRVISEAIYTESDMASHLRKDVVVFV